MKSRKVKAGLREQLLSKQNIFLAVSMADSYIQNKDLLSLEEQKDLVHLKRVFDMAYMTEIMDQVDERLRSILEDPADFFESVVYFKPKKYQEGKTVFRPLHTASLVDQISMTAMLQVLVYDFSQPKELLSSELGRLLPSNFYGNIVSNDGRRLFRPWQDQYQKYSQKANTLLSRYSETKEYRYEVSLDLKNFFPSIDPRVLYYIICEKLPLNWIDDPDIHTILRKLLFFRLGKLNRTERGWYLPDKTNLKGCPYAKGLPQGLPHTYFLANLFMLQIQKEYEKVFHGEMVFYVDDSVIFTNGPDGFLNQVRFKECIDTLNRNIHEMEEGVLAGKDSAELLPEGYPYSGDDFGVLVHRDTKSTFSSIPDARVGGGEIYLHGLSREASNISFDIPNVFSETDADIMLSRVRRILEIISKEIERICEDEENEEQEKQEVYLNKLLRYRRFFKYRETILSFRVEGDIERIFHTVIDDIALREDEGEIKKFYEKYTDDILAAAIQFVFTRLTSEQVNERKQLIAALEDLAGCLYGKNTEHAYILKTYELYMGDEPEYWSGDPYQDLTPALFARLHSLLGQKDLSRWDQFRRILKKGEEELFCYMGYGDLYSCSEYVRAGSDTLIRMLLNAIYSYIFEYDLEDRFVFARRSRKPIEYDQLRVLAALRNPWFSYDGFIKRYEDYTQEECHRAIDYSILQVMEIFKTFVRRTDWIDQLILTHKYCCDTWKNGSKFLHFYTLHNQEHAVNLIHGSIQWIHAIDFFKLKQMDYFILFAACYLHDISMVTLPNTEKFYVGDNPKANQICTELEQKLNTGEENKKRALYEAYSDIDAFFEHSVRSGHAADSAGEIRRFPELDFFDISVREFIARVSEAHGYDTADVYMVKATGKEALINEKFIKIILRLSDLSDMSRYRISKVVLNHNLTNLNNVSRFHWISHLITDDCHISVKHVLAEGIDTSKSFLRQGAIVEELELTVDVLMSQTTASASRKCGYVSESCYHPCGADGDPAKVVITCDQDSSCGNPQCIFLCKWFTMKNEYLLKELAALKGYLNSVPDNFFAVDTKINVRVIENRDIPNDLFDYLKDFVDGKK